MRLLTVPLVLLALAVPGGCGLCGNTDEVQVKSPDMKHVARAYLYDCGATTRHTTRVDISVDADRPSWLSVYTADRAYDVTLRWGGPQELVIECNGCPPRHPLAPPVEGIAITVNGATSPQ